jgi:Immunoglobulin I-set domain
LLIVAPRLRQRPRNSIGLVNSDKDLTCDIYSNPQPVIQWIKDGSPIIPDDYVQIVNTRMLRILGLTPSDGGMYQCFAFAAEAGSLQASAQLIVLSNGKLIVECLIIYMLNYLSASAVHYILYSNYN